MSADIYGWVEVQARGDTWEGVIKVHHLVPHSHRIFSLLFGDKDHWYDQDAVPHLAPAVKAHLNTTVPAALVRAFNRVMARIT